VTIGHDTRVFHAFVTSAPIGLDAPATITLYVATLADVAGFAANEFVRQPSAARSQARLVLVDGIELNWQRARYRQSGYQLMSADAGVAGSTTLQLWLWRRLLASPTCRDERGSHGADPSAR
jgi:hypothetical protein